VVRQRILTLRLGPALVAGKAAGVSDQVVHLLKLGSFFACVGMENASVPFPGLDRNPAMVKVAALLNRVLQVYSVSDKVTLGKALSTGYALNGLCQQEPTKGAQEPADKCSAGKWIRELDGNFLLCTVRSDE
jgi:hypothetical protein